MLAVVELVFEIPSWERTNILESMTTVAETSGAVSCDCTSSEHCESKGSHRDLHDG